MQAAVQRHVERRRLQDNQLARAATVNDIRDTYLAAWRAKVKGITIYRYGSREGQVLTFAAPEPAIPQAGIDFTGGCVGHVCGF